MIDLSVASPTSRMSSTIQPSQTARLNTSDVSRRFLIGFAAVAAVSAAVWPFLPRRFEAMATVIIRAADDDGRFDHAKSLRQPLDDGAVQSEVDTIAAMPLSAEVATRYGLDKDPEFAGRGSMSAANLTSTPVSWTKKWLSWTGALSPSGAKIDPARELLSRVIVNRDRRSYTVRLGYWSADPIKAAELANGLVAAYFDRQEGLKRDGLERQAQAMRSRLLELASLEETQSRAIGFARAETRGAVPQTPPVQLASFSFDGLATGTMGTRGDAIALSDERTRTREAEGDIRQKLLLIAEQQARVVPDAELLAPAVAPLSATFPNPLLMAIATVLAGSAAGLAFAWPAMAPALRRKEAGPDGPI